MQGKVNGETAAVIFKEWLTFVRHRSNVMLWDFEFVNKRAQAQMTAVHSYIAQKDAQLSQKLSEYSTALAADSREIAAASKRDSSAMKGIAFLTMVLLPGTYIATFFAMPLLDFSTPTPTSKPGFWIYWAVTAPLTVSVLAIYLTYLARVSRRNQEEDKRARNETLSKKDSNVSRASIKSDHSENTHGFFSMLSDTSPQNWFRNPAKSIQPNPELGLSDNVELAQLQRNAKSVKPVDNVRRVGFGAVPTSGDVSLFEDPGSDDGGYPPALFHRERTIRRPGLTRPRAFQTQPTAALSDSDEDSGTEGMGAVTSATKHHAHPKASRSLNRSNMGLSTALDMTNAQKASRRGMDETQTIEMDSNFGSDSSHGL